MDAVQVDDVNRKAGGFTHNIEVPGSGGLLIERHIARGMCEYDRFYMASDSCGLGWI